MEKALYLILLLTTHLDSAYSACNTAVTVGPSTYCLVTTSPTNFQTYVRACLEEQKMPFWPESEAELSQVMSHFNKEGVFLAAYKVNGAYMSFTGHNAMSLTYIQWAPGHPDLTLGNGLKVDASTMNVYIDDGPGYAICMTPASSRCMYEGSIGFVKNRYCIMATIANLCLETWDMCTDISMRAIGVLSRAKAKHFPLDWPMFHISDTSVLTEFAFYIGGLYVASGDYINWYHGSQYKSLVSNGDYTLDLLSTMANSIWWNPVTNRASTSSTAMRFVMCEDIPDPCTDQLLWKDHALLAIHFFDYPVGYVFQDGEVIPDRSGRDHVITLYVNGTDPPSVMADSTGLKYLRMDLNTRIVVTGNADLNSLGMTLEVFGKFEAPTQDVFVHEGRVLRFPSFEPSGDVYAKTILTTGALVDKLGYYNLYGQLKHFAFRKSKNNNQHSILIDGAITATQATTTVLSDSTDDIFIGEHAGVSTRGDFYFLRLSDIFESRDNLTSSWNCMSTISSVIPEPTVMTTEAPIDTTVPLEGNVTLFTTAKTWKAAKRDCERQGLKLVDLGNDTERDNVMATVYNASCQGPLRFSLTWSGLHYSSVYRTARWSDSSPVQYTNYPLSEEVKLRDGKCAAFKDISGEFIVADCDEEHPYICEGDIEIPECNCVTGICCNGQCFCDNPLKGGVDCSQDTVSTAGLISERIYHGAYKSSSSGQCEAKGLYKYAVVDTSVLPGSTAEIHSMAMEQTLSCGVSEAFIAMWNAAGIWKWRDFDQTTVDVYPADTFWGVGEPSTELCGSMNGNLNGWAAVDCGMTQLSYICLGGYDVCASNPCQNNGTCCKIDFSYVCSCPPGYIGDQCQIVANGVFTVAEFDAGRSSFSDSVVGCKDLGLSLAEVRGQSYWEDMMNLISNSSWPTSRFRLSLKYNSYHSYARWETSHRPFDNSTEWSDWYADLGQAGVDECLVVDEFGWFPGPCDHTFSGLYICEGGVDVCASSPCVNGGTCWLYMLQWMCRCPDGYTGQNCQYSEYEWNDACTIEADPDTVVLLHFTSASTGYTDGTALPNLAPTSATITMHGTGNLVLNNAHKGLQLDPDSYLEISAPKDLNFFDELTIEIIAQIPATSCFAVWSPNSYGLAEFQNGMVSSWLEAGSLSGTQTHSISDIDDSISNMTHHYVFTFDGYNLTTYLDDLEFSSDTMSAKSSVSGSQGTIYVGKGSGCDMNRTEDIVLHYLRIEARAKTYDEINRVDRLCVTDCGVSDPCQNGGICIDSSTGSRCKCPPAYRGINCEDPIECYTRTAGINAMLGLLTTLNGSNPEHLMYYSQAPLNDVLACEDACAADPHCWAYTLLPHNYSDASLAGQCYGRSDFIDVSFPEQGTISGHRDRACSLDYTRNISCELDNTDPSLLLLLHFEDYNEGDILHNGDNVTDYTNNPDLSISIQGTANIVSSEYGYHGIHLTAPSTYIEIKEDSVFNFNSQFTFEAVIKAEVNPSDLIMSDSHFWFPVFDGQTVLFGVFRLLGYNFRMSDYQDITIHLSATRIHYYALTFNKGELNIFVDSELVYEAKNLARYLSHGEESSVLIGGEDSIKAVNMTLYMLKISTRAKYPSEIYNFASCEVCRIVTCQNQGVCIINGTANGTAMEYCWCPSGYAGEVCETDLDLCSSAPCLNNGTCMEESDGRSWFCNCTLGYGGRECNIVDYQWVTCAARTDQNTTLLLHFQDNTPGDKLQHLQTLQDYSEFNVTARIEIHSSPASIHVNKYGNHGLFLVRRNFIVITYDSSMDFSKGFTVELILKAPSYVGRILARSGEFKISIWGSSTTGNIGEHMLDAQMEYKEAVIYTAFTFNGTAMKLYANGVLKEETQYSGSGIVAGSTENIYIGKSNLDLWIYYVRISDGARTDDEIATLDPICRGYIEETTLPDTTLHDETTSKEMTTSSSGIGTTTIASTTKGTTTPKPVTIPKDFPCPSPPEFEHSYVDDLRAVPGSTSMVVRYQCNAAYEYGDTLLSTREFLCSGGVWKNDLVDCSIIQCPPLPQFTGSVLDTEERHYDVVVTVYCKVGHTFGDGSLARTIMCLLNKEWSNIIEDCQPLPCPSIPTLPGTDYIRADMSYNQEVLVQCDEGLTMEAGVQEQVSYCTAVGEWQQYPTSCSVDQCITAPYHENSGIGNTSASLGSELAFTCDPGYRFVDGHRTKVLTCNGDWEGELSECKLITCPPVQEVPNGEYSTTVAIYGTIVLYNCFRGYEFPNNDTMRYIECLETGNWNVTLPPCQEILCPDAPLIENALFDPPDSLSVSTNVTYTCASADLLFIDGYDEKTLQCSFEGDWTGIQSDCQGSRCPPLPLLTNQRPVDSFVNTTVGNTLGVVCIEGYTFPSGSPHIYNFTCVEDSSVYQWQGESVPECLEVFCPTPPEVTQSYQLGSSYAYASIVNVTCYTGFELEEDVTFIEITCLGTGKWSVDIADMECQPVVCGFPPTIGNATTSKHATTYDSVVVYTCPTGYMMPGNLQYAEIRCQADKQWSLIPENCTLLYCPPIPVWLNINASTTDAIYLTQVEYQCAEGYIFEDRNQNVTSYARCNDLAEWEPELGDCKFGSASFNDYTPTDVEDGQMFGTIALSILGAVAIMIIFLDIFTVGKDIAILKLNLRDMVLNLKYGFPKEPDVVYVRVKRPPRPKTAYKTSGMGMFKVSRPVYYKSRQRVVSKNNDNIPEEKPAVEEDDTSLTLNLDGLISRRESVATSEIMSKETLSTIASPRDVSTGLTPRPNYYS